MSITAGILTISDKGSQGERDDLSGREIRLALEKADVQVIKHEIVPDEIGAISGRLKQYADEIGLDIIITTGGTGVTPRDVTPEATRAVLDREIPGIAEAMRFKGLESTPYSALSRALAGTRRNSLIINLPGSPKAVREGLSVVIPLIRHATDKIKGDPSDCAT